jgi:3-hydroxyacyl-CoA dehydrogenase
MGGVTYAVRDGIAIMALDNPPVNALTLAVRRAIVAGIDRAQQEPQVAAIILTGAGKHFSAGADIGEFATAGFAVEPTLPTVIRAIEESEKPVIASIAGVCLGGGLELALGCHFRIATPDAEIAFPEVKLGLVPGAGGTQRLPRAIGVEGALNMIVSGTSMRAERLSRTALFDEIAEGDPLDAALAFARKTVQEERPRKRIREMKNEHPEPDAFFQYARNAIRPVAKHLPAPLKCVDAIAASVRKPFEEGLAVERDIFVQLLHAPESQAQRHAFMAERAAGKIPDLPENTKTRDIARVAVIGAGTMGSGIAMAFLNAGIPVTLLEVSREALDKGVAAIRKNYDGSVQKNKLTPDQVESRLKSLDATLSYEAIANSDLAIEAVFEDLSVKEGVFRKLDQTLRRGAILATNTSTLDVNRIANFTGRPADVLGMHFFSPAHVMRLLEVIRGKATAPDVLATVMQLARRINKTAVVSGVCDGFIGNRMLLQYERQAYYLLEEGATPQQVDRALENWGMAMGPFRMGDMVGNDISRAIRDRHRLEKPELRFSGIPDRLCDARRFGQKTGAGWYRYEPGARDPLPDPAVESMIDEYRKEKGIAARRLGDEEIVQRCVFALVNEGARILDEGIAARASDIDIVYLMGYGFPLHRGGPMFHADSLGLYNVARELNRLARTRSADADFWRPAPLLARLAAENGTFTGTT